MESKLAFLFLASSLAISCATSAHEPAERPTSAPAKSSGAGGVSDEANEAAITCATWQTLKPEHRFLAVGGALQHSVGRPDKSPLAACLWAISDQIAQHTVDLCATGQAYEEASGLALSTAIEFCQSRQ